MDDEAQAQKILLIKKIICSSRNLLLKESKFFPFCFIRKTHLNDPSSVAFLVCVQVDLYSVIFVFPSHLSNCPCKMKLISKPSEPGNYNQ